MACAPDPLGLTIGELPKGPDCRIDDDCDGGYGPADQPTRPTPPPPPDSVPDCDGATYPSSASTLPFATDHRLWLRDAHRYANREGRPAGYVNFHSADYGAGTVHGTVLIDTVSVAFWRDVPTRLLGNHRIDDVPNLMRVAQAHARAIGYNAALPTFEHGIANGEEVYGLTILSPAAIEIREVDACELGLWSEYDVAGVFRGAHSYAERIGAPGAIPTFETRITARGRKIFTLIIFQSDRTVWRDVDESEVNPECGRGGLRPCPRPGPACDFGFEVGPTGTCERRSAPRPPPPCGGHGEECCPGGECSEGAVCNYQGLFRPSVCGEPPRNPCGDGACTADEACWCQADCASVELCRVPECELRIFRFCSVCPNGLDPEDPYRSGRDVQACSYEIARESVARDFGGCEILDGECSW